MSDAPGTSVRALTCPNCGGTIALRAAGSTVSIVCEHCGSTLDATRPDLAVIVRADQALRRPEIALGTRGVLGGVTWEVVGYQERTDEEVDWREYLLFNPYEGYAFLVDDKRRFSLGRLMTVLPRPQYGNIVVGNEVQKRFCPRYTVHTRFVVGEFYWRVRVGDSAEETDFVRPGRMIVSEETGNERTWTTLEMQDWGVAERAFGIAPRRIDYSGSIAPHEPSPYRQAMRDAWMVAALALAACIVIAIGTAGSTRALTRELSVPLDGATRTTVLGPIAIPGARERVRVQGSTFGLDNMWVDLDYSLVNRQTQASYDASGTAERYSGHDSDGSWSEGNEEPRTGFAAIPRGTYDLVVETTAHRWTDPNAPITPVTTSYTGLPDLTGIPGYQPPAPPAAEAPRPIRLVVRVDRGGGFAGPFFLALIALMIWPIIAWGRHMAFEHRRVAPAIVPYDFGEDDE